MKAIWKNSQPLNGTGHFPCQ